jgi:hypothetical protein
MTEYACYACHGLGLVQPIDTLAAWLDANTPKGIRFRDHIVGGMDPQLEEGSIRASIQADIDAGRRLIFVGHSKGAMLAYYLGYPAALVVAIDPTDWGSNIECPNWDLTPPRPGQWEAPDNVTRWINFHQSGYPGGGVLANPGPVREDHFFPDCDHMSIVNDPRTMKIIHSAIIGAMS